MKKTTFTLATISLAAFVAFSGADAFARNSTIENELKSRSNLSSFYDALVTTGVIEEMNSGVSYTVFAPTNEAMAEITRDKYPCFYSAQCKAEIADILRNHIVVGEVNYSSPSTRGAYSIDNKPLVLGQPGKGHLTVDGHEVLKTNQLVGNVVHQIDGVITTPQELATITRLKHPETAQVTKHTVTEKVYYAPDGIPDGKSSTTTVTTTTVD